MAEQAKMTSSIEEDDQLEVAKKTLEVLIARVNDGWTLTGMNCGMNKDGITVELHANRVGQ